MTKNVTLRLDVSLLRYAQHAAVKDGLSLSAWLSHQIQEWARGNRGNNFDRAKSSALERLRNPLRLGGRIYSRDQLHVR